MNNKKIMEIIKENCMLKNAIIQIIEINERNLKNKKIEKDTRRYLQDINFFLETDILGLNNSLLTKTQMLENIEKMKKSKGR